jgi:hypothetical protein
MYVMVDMLLDVVITGHHITSEGDMAMVEGGVVGTRLSNSI